MSFREIETDDLLDKPYRKDATGPDAYDCYNLCREVYHRAGLYLPPREYIEDAGERSIALDDAKSDCVKLQQPEPYCIVAICGEADHPDWVTHLGVVLANRYQFIHIRRNHYVTIDRLDCLYGRGRIEGYYRYVGPKADTSQESV